MPACRCLGPACMCCRKGTSITPENLEIFKSQRSSPSSGGLTWLPSPLPSAAWQAVTALTATGNTWGLNISKLLFRSLRACLH